MYKKKSLIGSLNSLQQAFQFFNRLPIIVQYLTCNIPWPVVQISPKNFFSHIDPLRLPFDGFFYNFSRNRVGTQIQVNFNVSIFLQPLDSSGRPPISWI